MLKGTTEFILTDVNTGEEERIVEDNMFTNALEELINNTPYFFGSVILAKQNTAEQINQIITPMYNKALGGLLLFPEPIIEDADTLYAPADNKPTGIASNDAYSGEDARRGSLNGIASGFITENGEPDGKKIGYRYVWDFSTTQANGKISCACLTSAMGGAGYLDGDNVLLHKNYYSSYPRTVGLTRSYNDDVWGGDSDTIPQGFVFGAGEKGIYFRRVNGYIGRNTVGASKIGLWENPNEYDYLFPITNIGALALVGDDVWIIRTNGNSSGNATVNIDKYIEADDYEMHTESITVSAPLKKTEWNYTCAVVNGYLYMCGYGDNGVYKINLSNLADVTKIEVSVPSSCLYSFGNMVSSTECFIDSENEVHITGLKSAPCALHGVWAILSQANHSTYQVFLSASVFMPYLATINNVKTITKDATKTLQVIYSVREV